MHNRSLSIQQSNRFSPNASQEFFLKAKPAKFDWEGGIDPRSFTFAAQVTSTGDTAFHAPGQGVAPV